MTDAPLDLAELKRLLADAGGPRRWRYLSMKHHIDIDWCGFEDDDSANIYVNVGHILIDGEPTETTKDHARARLIVGALNALPALIARLEQAEAALSEAQAELARKDEALRPFAKMAWGYLGDQVFDDEFVVLDLTEPGSVSLIRRITRGDLRRADLALSAPKAEEEG